jgi:cell shape-determining protein MreC
MSQGRINNLFLILLLFSTVSAFFLPVEYLSGIRGISGRILEPVAYPVRKLGQFTAAQFSQSKVVESSLHAAQSSSDAQREIERLRATIASLTLQLEEMRKLLGERQSYGAVWKFSRAFKVQGAESSWRKSLTLRGDTRNLTVGMPVLSRQGLIGRVSSIGPTGAQARLTTEKGFYVTGAFLSVSPPGRIIKVQPPPLIEGRGDGSMMVTNLTMDSVKSARLGPGDIVIVSDTDLPSVVIGQALGRIERIGKLAREPLYAELIIKPVTQLDQLTEVMVVVGEQDPRSLAEIK